MAVVRDVTKRLGAQAALRRMKGDLEKEVLKRTADLITANNRLEREIEGRKNLQHELLEITGHFQ